MTLQVRHEILDMLMTVLDEETAVDLHEYRRERARLDKKSVWTMGAAKGLVRELAKHPDPNAAALEMMARGWLTNKVKWPERRQQDYRRNSEAAHNTVGTMLFGEDNGAAHDEPEHSRWH